MARKRTVVILAPGFEEVEAVAPIDVLRRAGVDVIIAGLDGLTPKGSRGVVVGADVQLDRLSGEFDAVVYPGGMPGARNLGESPEAKKLGLDMFRAGKLVAAICAAPVMTLGAWGILDGRNATCFPGMENMFPKDTIFSPERVVVDGTVITARGPGVALEFGLALATRLVGADMAAKLAVAMLVEEFVPE